MVYFNEYRIRYVIRKDETMILSKFKKNLNEILDERLSIEMRPLFLVQKYKVVTKARRRDVRTLVISFLGPNLVITTLY